jgi:glycine cleavage system pyridoxal-binding protein P
VGGRASPWASSFPRRAVPGFYGVHVRFDAPPARGIAGETTDDKGKPRIRADITGKGAAYPQGEGGSNICSNQALCAMTAAVYMAAMGPEGMRGAALQSMSKAHYLAAELQKIGFTRVHRTEFFHEFVHILPSGQGRSARKAGGSRHPRRTAGRGRDFCGAAPSSTQKRRSTCLSLS